MYLKSENGATLKISSRLIIPKHANLPCVHICWNDEGEGHTERIRLREVKTAVFKAILHGHKVMLFASDDKAWAIDIILVEDFEETMDEFDISIEPKVK